MKLIGWYSIMLGSAVIGMWTMILLTQVLPEGPVEVGFHLVSEGLMALLSVAAGLSILRKQRIAISLTIAAHAMVIYSTMNATGYYGQQGSTPMLIFFCMLCAISAAILVWSINCG